jgi:hypothetical protein
VLEASILRPGILATESEWENQSSGGPEAASLIYRETGGHSWRNDHPFFLLANRCVVFVAIDATRFLVLL